METISVSMHHLFPLKLMVLTGFFAPYMLSTQLLQFEVLWNFVYFLRCGPVLLGITQGVRFLSHAETIEMERSAEPLIDFFDHDELV